MQDKDHPKMVEKDDNKAERRKKKEQFIEEDR